MRQLEEWSQFGTEEEGFPCLQELYLQRCPNLKEKLPNACPSVVKLVINECMELASPLPRLSSLKYLELKGCDKVVWTSVVNFPSLEFLYINGIPNLPCLPNGFSQRLPPIFDLTIGGCDEITSLSNQIGFQHLTSLRKLKIYGCPKLENLPHGLHSLSSLTRLRIEGCRSLSSFPEMGLPSMLTDLTIEECEDLESLPGGMVHNSNLEILSVRGCSSLLSFAGEFNQLQGGTVLVSGDSFDSTFLAPCSEIQNLFLLDQNSCKSSSLLHVCKARGLCNSKGCAFIHCVGTLVCVIDGLHDV
ncbi:hypothetical protein F0562_018775 [Nyssa sinensis]|uniref:Disease resistance protein At4g27190-like leucine-rich repeats domain-containing protein n=1 Tax=Nyssa sinensis TaxID=561372 RepID=A0A5J4ZCV9_9ASTE|nr:hypothetical protein F0562_018775 [Nyssa sinensis]